MPSRRRRSAGRAHQRSEDPPAGMPVGRYDPITPAGRAEQTDKLLAGLARQRGWRRDAARLLAVIALLLILVVIVLQVSRLGRL